MKKHLSIYLLRLLLLFFVIQYVNIGCQKNKDKNSVSDPKDTFNSKDTDSSTENHFLKIVKSAENNSKKIYSNHFRDSSKEVINDTSSDSENSSHSPWEWKEIPKGENCGLSCTRLTFEDGIRERDYDIWGNKIVYTDKWFRVYLVDIEKNMYARLPDMYKDFPSKADGSGKSSALSPTIYENSVYYSLGVSDSLYRYEIVKVDLDSESQKSIWKQNDPLGDEENYYNADEMDVYGDILITRGSTGNPFYRTLGYHSAPWEEKGKVLIDDCNYGGSNSIWKSNLVFWETHENKYNISGYNFNTEKFFSITNDEKHQLNPRIHENHVVYTDLRLGASNIDGTWEHAAIYMYNLKTKEVKQITDGTTIASYPDIYENLIVWMDWRNCPNPNDKNDLSGIEIWGYNIETNREFQITNLPEYKKGFPRIWKNKLYVQMFKGTDSAIYQFELPDDI